MESEKKLIELIESIVERELVRSECELVHDMFHCLEDDIGMAVFEAIYEIDGIEFNEDESVFQVNNLIPGQKEE